MMGLKIDSNFQPKKCAKRCDGDGGDRISELPDEILVAILSFLPQKEAGRASILSSRWVNLWRHTSSLDFDDYNALCRIANFHPKKTFEQVTGPRESRNEERLKYANWVNYILQSHKAPILKEFRICFDFDRSAHSSINQWLGYAFARQVEKLELDLSAYIESLGNCNLNYCFPEEEFLTQSSDSGGVFKSLKALSLKCVNVTGEAVEFFLRNCPLLEQLVVHHTTKISKLEVCGSSLKLKHLELCYCYGVTSIKVSAPNLTSLSVTMLEGLLLENVPMLVELSVYCNASDGYFIYAKLFRCIFQLEILTLKLANKKFFMDGCKFLGLPKLKKLIVELAAEGDDSLVELTSFLINGSPCLEEFVLQLSWHGFELSRSDRKVVKTLSLPHQHLKVVRFRGYYGRTSDVELVRYFLDNCIALEKVIIDPSGKPWFPQSPISSDDLLMQISARNHAKQQLEGEVPQHIELVII